MKNRIRKALEANDTGLIRTILIESMSEHAGRTATLLEISEVITNVPGLFDTDDGKKYPAAHEMTPAALQTLAEDLHSNFSLPKYRLFTEVSARVARDPKFSLKQEQASETETVAEGVLIADTPVEAAPREGAEEYQGNTKPGKGKALRIFGFALMAAGIASAIVGICIPIRFLIGLSIGVIMLGSAVVYSAIPRT